ncbi:SDR family oxidoreductase [Chitinimonas sp. BJYL2]|uniref:SDR family oxidoreductase n=1 Tax=Chitinimonas sp. BJYL2 TaxID=2976696 RepID=UPI0022B43B21|nr:SDR family oxidoreductase [Chitinimonas sp. BJYL2]
MNILLTGASGLIGTALLARLLEQGHRVRAVCRHPPAQPHPNLQWRAVDLQTHCAVADWVPLLDGVDCVINTAGLFTESPGQSFAALHVAAPLALFTAASEAGIRRILQVSALGADSHAAVDYWRSKGEADARLMALPVDWLIVRPSLVYADHGASSQLFRQLATLPILAVPAGAGPVQPIHLDDLIALLLALIDPAQPGRRIIDAVGAASLPLADYLQALRKGMGMRPARVWSVPAWCCALAVRLAPAHSLLSPQSLHMLRHARAANPQPCAQLLARPLQPAAHFARPHLRGGAVIATWQWLLIASLAFVWLWTVWASWRSSPIGLQLLADAGLPAGWQGPALYAGIGLDFLLGVLTLTHPSRRLWQVQLGLVLAYTVYISLTLPDQWLHPFGPISKNLPILALLGVLIALSPTPSKAR